MYLKTRKARTAAVRHRDRAYLVAAILVLLGAVTAFLLPVGGLGSHAPASKAQADPAEVLRAGAAQAAALDTLSPRADQFLYEEIRFPNGKSGQFWLSIDGQHDGKMIRPDLGGTVPIPGCVDGRQYDVKGFEQLSSTHGCRPALAFDPSIPTDPAEFSNHVLQLNGGRSDETAANTNGKQLLDMLEFTYLTGPQRAALVESIANLPGLRVATDVTRGSQTPSISIAWSVPGPAGKAAAYSGEMELDSTSYAFLGSPGGDQIITALIVDQAGQTS